MLRLKLQTGEVANRVFSGFIQNAEDLSKFVNEVEEEFVNNGKTLLVEIWEIRNPTVKKLKLPTEAEEMMAFVATKKG